VHFRSWALSGHRSCPLSCPLLGVNPTWRIYEYTPRNSEWELIANPIVDVSFGSTGEADFAPALRLAHNLGDDHFVGLEYYADFGKIGNFLPLQQQSQQLFAVTDFKVGNVDIELGGMPVPKSTYSDTVNACPSASFRHDLPSCSRRWKPPVSVPPWRRRGNQRRRYQRSRI
jgi:hypothetical protein